MSALAKHEYIGTFYTDTDYLYNYLHNNFYISVWRRVPEYEICVEFYSWFLIPENPNSPEYPASFIAIFSDAFP